MHGTAKSFGTRVLRNLIDPCSTALRSQPSDGRDLAIAAKNCWIVALDNVSGISPWLSDALCRLSTGGGFGTRQLYTDSEEGLFNASRLRALRQQLVLLSDDGMEDYFRQSGHRSDFDAVGGGPNPLESAIPLKSTTTFGFLMPEIEFG
jgi:hypothetical protein